MREQINKLQVNLQNNQNPRHWSIMFHVLRHMPAQLARWGPVKDHWMFSFEDFFGFAMTLIKTRSNPVQSILKHDGDRLVLGMAKALIMHKAAGTNVCSVCVYVSYLRATGFSRHIVKKPKYVSVHSDSMRFTLTCYDNGLQACAFNRSVDLRRFRAKFSRGGKACSFSLSTKTG